MDGRSPGHEFDLLELLHSLQHSGGVHNLHRESPACVIGMDLYSITSVTGSMLSPATYFFTRANVIVWMALVNVSCLLE